ncbi:cytochrome P450 2C25-like [Diceros bicornis minor]|uniref:cytochrome P450 2C25-like n=1 Tax=Diceros bicornis minor TaxID=77932 RepID=UPI0026F15D19|nr:cytochrome P450 2C25-like [Diceros bicornis minor]
MLGGQGIRSSQPPLAPAKVQAELDAVVGRMRAPCLEDRGHLPYTNAVLHEIQHFITVLPLGMSRAVTCDTHLHGQFLPKVPTEPGDSAWAPGSAYEPRSAGVSVRGALIDSCSPGSKKACLPTGF